MENTSVILAALSYLRMQAYDPDDFVSIAADSALMGGDQRLAHFLASRLESGEGHRPEAELASWLSDEACLFIACSFEVETIDS
jgi:tyrosyl-tRNA synthetase